MIIKSILKYDQLIINFMNAKYKIVLIFQLLILKNITIIHSLNIIPRVEIQNLLEMPF